MQDNYKLIIDYFNSDEFKLWKEMAGIGRIIELNIEKFNYNKIEQENYLKNKNSKYN